MKSEYYCMEVSTTQIEQAWPYYVRYHKERGLKQEVPNVNYVDESNIDHILYHAELMGYRIA